MNDVDLVNEALVMLGEKKVASLADETPQAIAASTVIDTVKKSMLEEFVWNFALKWIELTNNVTNILNPEYDYEFTKSIDMIRVIDVRTVTNTPVFWKVESNKILTKVHHTIRVKYIENLPANFYPPTYAKAVAARIALEIANTIREDIQLVEFLDGQYQRFLMRARHLDSLEGDFQSIIPDENSSYLRARSRY